MITTTAIITAAADHFGITVGDIRGHNRSRPFSKPRQVAMYLAKIHTDDSPREIGVSMGNRDRATINHGFEAVEGRLKRERDLHNEIAEIVSHARILSGDIQFRSARHPVPIFTTQRA